MFAAGGKKGKSMDKEGAARFKKDIITYKNQALQPASLGWHLEFRLYRCPPPLPFI
ncbi:unnamed protein product, partial [Laminaria digitata]